MPWRGIAVAATTVVACLTLLGRVVDFVVDWTWFSAVGYRDVFWTLFSTRAALFLTSFAATAMIIWGNGWLASRLTERGTGALAGTVRDPRAPTAIAGCPGHCASASPAPPRGGLNHPRRAAGFP